MLVGTDTALLTLLLPFLLFLVLDFADDFLVVGGKVGGGWFGSGLVGFVLCLLFPFLHYFLNFLLGCHGRCRRLLLLCGFGARVGI